MVMLALRDDANSTLKTGTSPPMTAEPPRVAAARWRHPATGQPRRAAGDQRAARRRAPTVRPL